MQGWTKRRRRLYLVAVLVFLLANIAALVAVSRDYDRHVAQLAGRAAIDGESVVEVVDKMHRVIRAEAMTILAAFWMVMVLIRSVTGRDDEQDS